MKRIISMLIVCVIMAATSGCASSKSESEKTQANFTRTDKADCSLWSEYNGLSNTYQYDAEYKEDEWADKDGNILFPYEASIAGCKDIRDNLSKLKMPDELVKTASTEDILKIVTDGWITDTVGNAFPYGTAEEYINYSTAANQAANELFLRSNMVEVMLKDYTERAYDESKDTALHYSSVLRFEEILLASDYAYDKMDDKTRNEVLKAVTDKINNTDYEVYYGCKCESGFFAYIYEQGENGGSKWKFYIEENGTDDAKKFLETKKEFVNAEYSNISTK